LKAFIQQHRITMSAEWADRNPNIDSMPPGSRHWRCTLRCGHRRMVVYFSQGPAIEREPTVEDVLDGLASDAFGGTFEDWCAELGYDSDSRKDAAEKLTKCGGEGHRLDHPRPLPFGLIPSALESHSNDQTE
jgi:hypothetical protein